MTLLARARTRTASLTDRLRPGITALPGLVAAALIVAAVALRGIGLGHRELFRDEAASWLLASYPLDQLVARSLSEPYPPLYAALLRAWVGVFGDSEAALRAMSAVLGLVVVTIGWRWANDLLGPRGGLLVLALLAFSPMALADSRNVRMYALEAAAAALAWWLLWRLLAGRVTTARGLAGHGLLLAVAVAVELWTMSYGVPLAALQALVALVGLLTACRGARADVRAAVWAFLGVTAGCLTYAPWVPITFRVATAGGPFWTSVPALWSVPATFGAMLVGFRADLVPLVVVAGPAIALGLVGLLHLARLNHSAGLIVGAWLAVVPVLWLYSQVHSAYDPRYFGSEILPFVICVGAGADLAAEWRARRVGGVFHFRAVPIVLLTACIIGSLVWWADWDAGQGLAPTNRLLDELRPQVRQGDVLLAVDARSYFTVAYAQRPSSGRALRVPLYVWDSGRQPFYYGLSLIEPAKIVDAGRVAAAGGWANAMSGLSPGGRIWLLALANGTNDRLGFAPLDDTGQLRQLARITVAPRNEAVQARELVVP